MQQTAYGLYIYKHTPHGEEESTCASSEVISGFSSWSVTDAELSWSSGISTLSDSAIVEDLVSESWENFAYSEVSERNHILYQWGFTTMMLNMYKLDCTICSSRVTYQSLPFLFSALLHKCKCKLIISHCFLV